MHTTRPTEHIVTRAMAGILTMILLLGMCPTDGSGKSSDSGSHAGPVLPFAAGEILKYAVQVGHIAAGHGTMSITGPVDVRGVSTLLLRSTIRAGSGMFSGSGRSQSWLDADRMTSLRFSKEERRVLSRHREAVEVYPDQRRWKSADGRTGTTPTDAPLDELSFIYFLRTLPLSPGAEFSFNRHFEAGRNPVAVRVLGRKSITVPAGSFSTVIVEMRVKDPRNYKGEGVIVINLTDDYCRIPVRIESTVPDVGKTVLALRAVERVDGQCAGK